MFVPAVSISLFPCNSEVSFSSNAVCGVIRSPEGKNIAVRRRDVADRNYT